MEQLIRAHYEVIRAMCASESLPPVRTLRQKLRLAWGHEQTTDREGQLHRTVKLFPVRVINCGAAQALASMTRMKLPTPPWLSALAYELEAFFFCSELLG